MVKNATQYLKTVRYTNTLCPEPCHRILTWFGYPIVTENIAYNGTGFVRLYFKNIIKVTQDFVSYDLLRLVTIIFIYVIYLLSSIQQKKHVCSSFIICSMFAEIGGYSGMLIGFSLLDLANFFRNIV